MKALDYMLDRGVEGIKRARFIGSYVVTDEQPERNVTLICCRNGEATSRTWNPPAGARCWMVWTRDITPDPLCEVWTMPDVNPVTLDRCWTWCAEEYPDPDDWQTPATTEAAALALAVAAAVRAMDLADTGR